MADTQLTFVDRLRQELEQLSDRVKKLEVFLDTTPFLSLDAVDQADLIQQHGVMLSYKEILVRRLARILRKN